MRAFIMALAYLTNCSPELILSRINYNLASDAIAESIDMMMLAISPEKFGYTTPLLQEGKELWYFVDMDGDYMIMRDVEFVLAGYELGSDFIGFNIYVDHVLVVEGASITISGDEYHVDI